MTAQDVRGDAELPDVGGQGGAPPASSQVGVGDDVLLSFVTLLLRRRRLIAAFLLAGAIVGTAVGLLTPRRYVARAVLQRPSASFPASGAALLASQLGFQVPSGADAGWDPGVYVSLLQSRGILEPIALDSFTLEEDQGRRAALADLLGIRTSDSGERVVRSVAALRRLIRVRAVAALDLVEVVVTTRWPSLSRDIARRLVRSVQHFNEATRSSEAKTERIFLEGRVQDAERDLREAEDRLQEFLDHNRSVAGSPELTLERDRLQRTVSLRQELYTRLADARDEARIREIRDTPVLTILESPRLPALPESRREVLSSALGLLAGGLLGLTIAIVSEGYRAATRRPSPTERGFFDQLRELASWSPRRRIP